MLHWQLLGQLGLRKVQVNLPAFTFSVDSFPNSSLLLSISPVPGTQLCCFVSPPPTFPPPSPSPPFLPLPPPPSLPLPPSLLLPSPPPAPLSRDITMWAACEDPLAKGCRGGLNSLIHVGWGRRRAVGLETSTQCSQIVFFQAADLGMRSVGRVFGWIMTLTCQQRRA